MKRGFVIAIDGPVAAGKSTVAPMLAEHLHGFYFWTGAMYRCLALYCSYHKIPFEDEKKVKEAAEKIAPMIEFLDNKVILSGYDVTDSLGQVALQSSLV